MLFHPDFFCEEDIQQPLFSLHDVPFFPQRSKGIFKARFLKPLVFAGGVTPDGEDGLASQLAHLLPCKRRKPLAYDNKKMLFPESSEYQPSFPLLALEKFLQRVKKLKARSEGNLGVNGRFPNLGFPQSLLKMLGSPKPRSKGNDSTLEDPRSACPTSLLKSPRSSMLLQGGPRIHVF